MKIAILGSTGSIGTQTLDVVRENKEHFDVKLLVANKSWELIVSQAKEFSAEIVILSDEQAAKKAESALRGISKVYCGKDAIIESVEIADLVVASMVGFEGLEPVLAAIKANKIIALANKETLVAGGAIVKKALSNSSAKIIPLDSEHAAVYNCLQARQDSVSSIYLTASGGPFFNKEIDFNTITPEQALKHPKWNMGAKISIDSATMMNKGLEVIEAAVLFDVEPEKIKVVVHPEHIIHAIVEYGDANSLAVMYEPDMRVAIANALMGVSEQDCFKSSASFLDFSKPSTLNFYPPNFERYPALGLCYEAIKTSQTAVLNAANEIAVSRFISCDITFMQIPLLVEKVLSMNNAKEPQEINELIQLDSWAREQALGLEL